MPRRGRRGSPATPTEDLTLALPDDSALLAVLGEPGAYFYMDLADPSEAVRGGIPTEWNMRQVSFTAGGGFQVELTPAYSGRWTPEGGNENTGGNAAVWGRSSTSGRLTMSINNLGALPGFAFEPGGERAKVIWFSPA